jgi:hypothetical protein
MSKRIGSFLSEILLPLEPYAKILPLKTSFIIPKEKPLDAVYSLIRDEHSDILETREKFLSEMDRFYTERIQIPLHATSCNHA